MKELFSTISLRKCLVLRPIRVPYKRPSPHRELSFEKGFLEQNYFVVFAKVDGFREGSYFTTTNSERETQHMRLVLWYIQLIHFITFTKLDWLRF